MRDYPHDVNVTSWGWLHLGSGVVLAAAAFTLFRAEAHKAYVAQR
ncbi:hypothetical protein [Streptomyces sp. NPDC048419]